MAASRITSITESITINDTAQNVYVTIGADVQTYYHTVVVTLGNQTVTKDVQTAGSITTEVAIPPSILNGMTTSATGTANVVLRTYTDSSRATLVGTATSSFTVRCTAYPTIGSITAAVGTNSRAYAIGLTTDYYAGYSTVLLTASNVSAKYGATIVSYTFRAINYDWSQTVSSSAASLSRESAELSSYVGQQGFTVTVTDSRGLLSYYTSPVYVNAKSISSLGWDISASATEIFFCDSSGVASEDGTYLSVKTTATATPSQNSVTALYFITREVGTSTYSEATNLTSGTATIKAGFNPESSYEVVIEATDALGNTGAIVATTVYGALVTMDFKAGGLGIAIGKVAEADNQVDSAWDIKTRGKLIINPDAVITEVGVNPDIEFRDKFDDAYVIIRGDILDQTIKFIRYDSSYDSTTGDIHVDDSVSETYTLPNDYGFTGNNVYKIITTKNLTDIPDASATQRGLVNTGAQTFTGSKTFNNAVYVQSLFVTNTIANAVSAPLFRLSDAPSANAEYARIYMAYENYGGVIKFREFSGTSSARTSYREDYVLPQPTSGRTSNATYNILTTKQVPVYITESSISTTTGTWSYRKYSDNSCDLWGVFSVTPTTSTATASGCYYSDILYITTPFALTTGTISGSADNLQWISNPSVATSTSRIAFRLMRGAAITTGSAVTVRLSVHGVF